LALTWKGETASPGASAGDKGREVGAPLTLTHDDFMAAVESLSQLVQEIASQVESALEISREATIADRGEVDDTLMPLLEEGKGTGEHSSEPS
jgi:hypothetical protein